MRTNIILKDELLKKAQDLTGIKEKTALIHKGLELLIEDAAARRLIQLGGSDSRAFAGPRKRPAK